MKFVNFYDDKEKIITYGIVDKNKVRKIEGSIFENYQITNKSYLLSEIKILPPCMPSKLVCVGLNYKDHAEEVKMKLPDKPLLFIKPNTTIIGQNEYIIYPGQSNRVDYEAELAIIMKKDAKNITVSDAKDFIFGYTCANDITARDLQLKDGQWTRAKSFDTFCPLGPFLVTDIDPANLDIRLFVNNELKQNSNTNQMIFGVCQIISYISEIMTLLAGDVVLTGTPDGIGNLNKGDEVIVSIDNIGELRNFVK
jgi:2-keto-4-pentenoate hydratase/2-oxohepta-3-ene-1,7-dioic acid hydratase in catechol pathway